MTDRLTLRLWEPQSAYEAIKSTLWPLAKAHLLAGRRMVLELRPASKTRDQEEKYHAMVGDIAKQAQHLGATWAPEDWKRLLVDKFARETNRTHGKVIPNLDKTGVVEVGVQTRKFSRADGSDFIEWLYAWGADNGIEWTEPVCVNTETGEIL